MKKMLNRAHNWVSATLLMFAHYNALLFLLVISTSAVAQTTVQDPEVAKLQRELDRRNKITNSRYVDNPSVRGTVNATNEAGFLAETVIAEKAAKLGIDPPTELEMHSMLLPMLAQQGLIDASCSNIFKDANVATWIKGQEGMTWADFRTTAKTLVLWTKIAIQDVQVTEDSVQAYVRDNPGMALVPAKVRIVLTQYVPPPSMASRSVMPHEVLAPTLALTTRAAAAEVEKPAPDAYEHLRLWLELDKIDPLLREAISGQMVGFKFGATPLNNGAIVEGYIEGFSPEQDLRSNPDFWAMAAVRMRLAKANQATEFEKIVTEFLKDDLKSPAVRGFWRSIWGGVKKSFSYIAGFGGGALAFAATGSPQAAFLGAKMGYQIGNAIKGWFSNGQISAPQFPSFPQGGFRIPPGYLGGNRFMIPPAYRSDGYQQTNAMPIMPYGYGSQMPQTFNPPPNNPYYSPMQDQWAPQMFFPQPVGYYF